MEDIAAGDAETAFQVERRQYLPLLNDRPDVRHIFLDQADNAVAERLPQLIPRAFTQRVGRVLEKDPHDVAAGRRQGRVVHSWNGQFQERALGRAPVLGVVPGALYILDAWADVHSGAMVRAGRAGIRVEFRQASQSEVDLSAGSFAAKAVNGGQEFGF